MFAFPHSPAMCLQQSRSAAVMDVAGIRQAIIGAANKRSESSAVADLKAALIIFGSIGSPDS